MMYSLIVVAIVVVIFTALLILKKYIPTKIIDKSIKILSIILFSLGILRCFLNDQFIWVINGGTYGEIYYKQTDIVQSLLRWGHYLCYIVMPCAAFFSKKIYKNVVVYFCFFVGILELFFFKETMIYFTMDSGRAIFIAPWARYIEYMAELVICLLVPLMIRFIQGYKFDYKNKQEWINFFSILPVMLMVTVPVYLPQSLFGFSNIYMNPLSIPNIMWILVVFSIGIVIYFIFRFKDYESRYSVLVFCSLLLFMHYNSIYLMDLVASRLPLQLCNLGAYLILIALLIKKQAFFDFVLLANVPGAAIALVAVDVSEGLLSFWNIHFYIEHTWVFILPILAVALKIFKRPTKRAYLHFFIGFTIYFLVCAISGIILNCFYYDPLDLFFNKVNYFYIFDTKVIGVLTFLQFTTRFPITISGYTFYPIYMIVIYILFIVFCLIFNYVYNILTNVGDDHFKLRQIRIKMKEEKGCYKNKKMPQLDYKKGEEVC